MKSLLKMMLPLITLILLITFKLDVQADSYTYWDGYGWAQCSSNDYTSDPIEISFEVTYDYEEAYKMLEYVNEERRKAGVQELILKDDLMDLAMIRAAEGNIYFEHSRPDGSDFQSLNYMIYSENLHGSGGPVTQAFNSLKNSEGHFENMMRPEYKYVGFGKAGHCWAQVFCVEEIYHVDGFDYKNPENNKPVLWDTMTSGQRTNRTEMVTVKVNPEKCVLDLEVSCGGYANHSVAYVDEVLEPTLYLTRIGPRGSLPFEVPVSEYYVAVTNDVTDKTLKCVKAGKTTIEVSLKDYPQLKATKDITIKKNEFKVNGNTYKITNYEKEEVTLLKAGITKKNITIPEGVYLKELAGDFFDVTSISPNAFKNNKKVQNVTIDSSVTSIGKNAFYGCKNLKKITVKSTKITNVGKNAFKGIHKKAVIKVPKSKLSTYKKLFKNKGQKKTVKIKQ